MQITTMPMAMLVMTLLQVVLVLIASLVVQEQINLMVALVLMVLDMVA